MKNTIGNPATGEDFFPRQTEIQKIIHRLQSGGHMQLTAPRRVGKTSILMYFLNNPLPGYHFVYVDTEAVADAEHYFKKIYEEILKCPAISKSARIQQQLNDKANRFLSRLKGVKLFQAQIELNEAAGIDYYEELTNFLKGIELAGEKIVLLNDEFPNTIENIIDGHNGETNEAANFLKINREFRLDPDISPKLQIVYTGSIGLNSLVERIAKTELVNDLSVTVVNPLHQAEALQMMAEILSTYGFTIEEPAALYLLQQIEWLIPFHIQLLLAELMDLTPTAQPITTTTIDKAFKQLVEYKNNSYFDHYYTRLRKHFKKNEFAFAQDLLCRIAAQNTLNSNEIYNLAAKHKVHQDLKSLLGTLAYDGYINNSDMPDTYRFNSPIIKMWWKKYVCN